MIRPSILGNPSSQTPPPSASNTDRPASSGNPELEQLITSIVTRVIREEGRLNPNSELTNATDETIRPEHRGQLSDLDKIPDIVRSLREFNGNPGEFSSWKKSVDRVLKIYESLRGTPKYYGILSVVRNKIVGNADIALESYSTPLDWKAISRCLTLHYADKRDITTLECQLTSLIQGNGTIQEFYQNVYIHLSLILNKLSSLEMSQESLTLLTQTYRHKALDTFIRGLKGDLPRLLGMKEPEDLPQALHLCLKLENQVARSSYVFTQPSAMRRFNVNPPPLPPRRHLGKPQPFFPQLAYIPGPRAQPQYQQPPQYYQQPPRNYQQTPQQNRIFQQPWQNNRQAQPFRPVAPKPQPRPEPMDIDRSIHSRNVNYINKPTFNRPTEKRPSNFSHQVPLKQQRNFHIRTGVEEPKCALDDQKYRTEYTSDFDEYHMTDTSYDQQPQEYFEDREDYIDVNFLG